MCTGFCQECNTVSVVLFVGRKSAMEVIFETFGAADVSEKR